jgi:hypothetical protein
MRICKGKNRSGLKRLLNAVCEEAKNQWGDMSVRSLARQADLW